MNKKLLTWLVPLLALIAAPAALAHHTYYHNSIYGEGSTGRLAIKHDATIAFWIECKPITIDGKTVSLYVSHWNYHHKRIRTCWRALRYSSDADNGPLMNCHNWNTIFGHTHHVTVYWECSTKCYKKYNNCSGYVPLID